MKLELTPKKIELIYDELDTNAINFILNDGYFSIQTCVYLEDDEQLNGPQLELNDQGNSQIDGLQKILLFKKKILLIFQSENIFLKKYKEIEINFEGLCQPGTIANFFSNHLFLGSIIEYSSDLDNKDKVLQTEYRNSN